MGAKLSYYLLVKPLSLLPFWVLYALSSFLSFVLHRVIRYRKKVVMNNLRNSFPYKSEDEIKQIAKRFYSHLADIMVESIKMFSISEKSIKKRMASKNSEIFDSYFKDGRDVVLVSGHIGNWEMWASGGAFQMPHKVKGVYKPLKNKFWDSAVQKSRGKYGIDLVSVSQATACLGNKEEPAAVALMIDQSPARTKKCFWTTFLHQETAVNFGAEYMAKEYDAPVIYGHIEKVRRGYYEVNWSLITDQPKVELHGFILERSTQVLEENLKKDPSNWLWTHKRWKRSRKPEEPLVNNLKRKTS